MNKRQTRLFAIGSTAVAALVFLALTIDSHRQFPKLTNAENITPAVTRGMDVWHANNCINCHTLFGEGAYYAPDLTKITQHRGDQYLLAYMRDPSKFYDEQRHRRLMPRQDLSDEEIKDLIAFLDWVSKVDNQGWPPRPILVAGASIPGTDVPLTAAVSAEGQLSTPTPVEPSDNPAALGQTLFRTSPPGCAACHSIAAGVNLAAPTLSGIATRATQIVQSPDYKGKAKDAAGYIRESIVEPSAHLIPGGMYSANGVSFMPNNYDESLKPEQIDQLVAFLLTLR